MKLRSEETPGNCIQEFESIKRRETRGRKGKKDQREWSCMVPETVNTNCQSEITCRRHY